MAGNNFNGRSMGHDVSDQPRLSNGQFTFKGSATAATIPSHKQQNVLEAPMPVSQNAPQEERMYPASVAGVAQDKIRAGKRLVQTVEPLPKTGQNAGPHKAAQVFFVVHALHGDKRQDEALVDARARVQHRNPDML